MHALIPALLLAGRLVAQSQERLCDSLPVGEGRRTACEAAVDSPPSPDSARVKLAEELVRAKEWHRAFLEYQEAARGDPRYINPIRDSLLLALARGTDLDSLWFARIEARLPPSLMWRDPVTARLLAEAHSRRGDLVYALATIDTLKARTPSDGFLYLEEGRLQLAKGDPRRALVAFRQATVQARGDSTVQAEAWAEMAKVALTVGRPATSLVYWDRVVSTDSTHFRRVPSDMSLYLQAQDASGVGPNAIRDSQLIDYKRRPWISPKDVQPNVR